MMGNYANTFKTQTQTKCISDLKHLSPNMRLCSYLEMMLQFNLAFMFTETSQNQT